MNLFRTVIIITSIVAVFTTSISIVNLGFLMIGTIASIHITRKYKFHENYAKYIVWLMYWVSCILMPAFHLVESNISFYPQIDITWNNRIVNFGIPIFAFSSCAILLCGSILSKRKVHICSFSPKLVPPHFLKMSIIGCIVLSIFCYSIGLGRMGSEVVVLPFHLGGIINLFRRSMVPILFAIVIEGYIIKGVKIPKSIWAFYLIFCVIEIFAWLSKSIIISHLQPVLLLLYIYYRPKLSQIIKIITPLLVAFLFMYDTIGVMRDSERGGSVIESYISAQNETSSYDEKSTILAPLNRAFMFGQQYAQDYNYINDNEIFDFSRTAAILLCGGSASFQTFYIDGYPLEAHHSSGTCGIMDPLLFGGIGFMYLILFMVIFITCLSDNLISKRYFSILIILIMQLLVFTKTGNVSTFIDSIGLQTYLLACISAYVAYRLNYRVK